MTVAAAGTGPRRLRVGRVVRPHGVRGRLKVELFAVETRLLPGMTLHLAPEAEAERLTVEAATPLAGPFVLLQVAGCASREQAEALRGAALWAERDALPPLEAGAYYVADLVGLAVETLEGAPLGTLAEVIETGAADVWVVRGEAGELLLPATREVVRRVDLAARRVVVAPLPGMVP